jgi:transposase
MIARFEDAAHLHAYAGVIPSTHSSGERSYHGKITKEGNRWLRWAAVEAVWLARRLLTIIFKMLKENRPYIP